MDSYPPPPHHYMRPPPPPPPPPSSMAGDPHMHHHPPPPPPPGSWFSGQFQYHPSHHSPSPPPPPPPQQHQWGPPPPPYAPPYQPPPAYSAPPPPPPPNHPYPNQDWGNANWSHHSGWEYPGHSNEEDWAAKARAWASARSAMENQHPQSQFTPMARQDERPLYSNQYSQPIESHYQDAQHSSVPTSSFQNYQPPAAPLSRPPMAHQHEHAQISSYGPDGHFSFTSNDGAPGGDIGAAFPHHQGSSSSSVHQQEVPSSYSSAPGNHEDLEGRQHGHSLSIDGRAGPIDQAQFAYGNHSLHPMDQPLEFTPRFSHENDPKMRSGYPDSLGSANGTDTGVSSSLHPWTAPPAPAGPYPPMAPAFPLAPQDDPSMGVPPFPGQPPAPMFERASSFPPAVPPIGGAVGLGGATLQPPAAFPVDPYGASLSAERPKKAAVPNWLREEIIKNKPTFTTASEHFKEGSESVDDEPLDKSMGKGDLADSKSMDSSKSTEEEDDDEDYQEAQRIAAMNQEIKRVLTEVLLKVTDEMFDEIATRVLNEVDTAADAIPDPDNGAQNQKLSPPPPPFPVPKASAKVLVPIKAKEPVSGNASTDSSSGSPGNVLGLANYDSDDDDDGENLTSTAPKAENDVLHGAGENGRPPLEADRSRTEGDANRSSAVKLNDQRMGDKDLDNNGDHRAKADDENESSHAKSDAVKSVDSVGKAGFIDGDIPAARRNSRKSSEYDSQERHQKKDEKLESHGKRDERHQKRDKEEDHHNITKERTKEHYGKDRDNKTRDGSDSRKRSPHREGKDNKKERDRDRKASSKDDAERKRERSKDEKDDRSRHKSSRRHKRRRSTSVGHRSKHSKGSPVDSDGSSGEASDDSRRKANPKRRNLSPSPVRSKQRQVSRSPHSKRSQRRHSPYSSLDGSRERRSRSRSPVRRHR